MNNLVTINAETLISTPLAPIRFVIEDLLPQGIYLLCGSPKIGKSWLALDVGLCVASGDKLWEFHCCQSDVLYLCLEDSYARIQKRLFELVDEAPASLHFTIAANDIDNGLIWQIEDFVNKNPQTKLIIIDTFQRVRGSNGEPNVYAKDYNDISKLKELADRFAISIVAVHHLRKLNDSDPFQKVSGTTGLTGAVDGTFVLEKDRRSGSNAKLYITGRDIEYREITLQFEDCRWKFISSANEQEVAQKLIPEFVFQVIDFMSSKQRWHGSATELLSAMGNKDFALRTVTKLLNQYSDSILAKNNILYDYKRTGDKRIITLTRSIYNDGNDKDDIIFASDD